jgi:hypothetical protein
MENLVCFSHPVYDGQEPPVLACKNCCKIFVSEVKRQSQSEIGQELEAKNWLESKKRQAMSHLKRRRAIAGYRPE